MDTTKAMNIKSEAKEPVISRGVSMPMIKWAEDRHYVYMNVEYAKAGWTNVSAKLAADRVTLQYTPPTTTVPRDATGLGTETGTGCGTGAVASASASTSMPALAPTSDQNCATVVLMLWAQIEHLEARTTCQVKESDVEIAMVKENRTGPFWGHLLKPEAAQAYNGHIRTNWNRYAHEDDPVVVPQKMVDTAMRAMRERKLKMAQEKEKDLLAKAPATIGPLPLSASSTTPPTASTSTPCPAAPEPEPELRVFQKELME